ncbi:uncharacterized protein BDV14DRAFT_191878 [Aspergillus stella-maris]|uniref:uncharacterized protein n=1 Tax=Aspergillus stella-maris TaxID=1810926 RepID=UPI003CCD0DF9
MKALLSFLALAALPIVSSALPYPFNIAERTPVGSNMTTADIITQLDPMLSSNSAIYGADDARWQNITSRCIHRHIVRYANSYGIPFLAMNTGHGSTSTLGRLKNGIQISLVQLRELTIAEDGASAVFGGGTGSCACVGIMGPGLGGGHGRCQGYYGLIIDMLISMNVVLANGTAITVSEDSYPDLGWAKRGAGHNLELTVDAWYVHHFIFTQDQLEDAFEVFDTHMTTDNPPTELLEYAVYYWNPDVSEAEVKLQPVIDIYIQYIGSEEDAASWVVEFYALNPVDFPLASNNNITANREIFDYFAEAITERPVLNSSVIVFEAYSVQGVQRVDSASTAFAHRDERFLSSIDEEAIDIGRDLQQLFVEGQPGLEQHRYVNYAFGDDPLEQMYGYWPWRLGRLRAAKAMYDSNNAFCFYNPIVRD